MPRTKIEEAPRAVRWIALRDRLDQLSRIAAEQRDRVIGQGEWTWLSELAIDTLADLVGEIRAANDRLRRD